MDTQISQEAPKNKYCGKQSPMIEKLSNIMPGETIMYYRGDFDRELPERGSDTAGVKRYKNNLRELRDYALALRDEGRIGIDAPVIKGEAKQGPYWYREYRAIGL